MDIFRPLVDRYRKRGVLVDTNLLVLLFVGMCGTAQIARHKRTSSFTEEDFILLASLLNQFSKIIVTPQILTETCNLLGQAATDVHREFLGRLKKHMLGDFAREEYIPTIEIVKHASFEESGLTDAGILETAKRGYLVLTVDFPLYGLLLKERSDAINFNHLRQMGWSMGSSA